MDLVFIQSRSRYNYEIRQILLFSTYIWTPAIWYQSACQIFFRNFKHMFPCNPKSMSNTEETVDIFLNVLWETFTKTFHPRHN